MFVVGVYSDSQLLGQGSGQSIGKAETAVHLLLLLLCGSFLVLALTRTHRPQAAQEALNKVWGEKAYTTLPPNDY